MRFAPLVMYLVSSSVLAALILEAVQGVGALGDQGREPVSCLFKAVFVASIVGWCVSVFWVAKRQWDEG